MKRIAAPIFMSGSSRDRLMMERAKPLLYSARTEILPGLWVTAIPTSHDCPGSVGFKIETEDVCVGYLTDLGCIPESTMDLLYGARMHRHRVELTTKKCCVTAVTRHI